MTDQIDLDEMDVSLASAADANSGDWFWRGEGDPDDEPVDDWLADEAASGAPDADVSDHDPIPHVPRENRDRPVGIPVEGGGAGGAAAADRHRDAAGGDRPSNGEPSAAESTAVDADSDSSDDAADELTMALTYDAVRRLAVPSRVVADARTWADWVGIVGDVGAHTINKFQRDHRVDVDFFNGSDAGPGERLADIDERSMFFAERMVVVGVDGDEHVAAAADWEFVPLETAAEKADWELTDGT